MKRGLLRTWLFSPLPLRLGNVLGSSFAILIEYVFSPQVRGADHKASRRLHQLGVTRVLELEFYGYGTPPRSRRGAGTSPQGEVWLPNRAVPFRSVLDKQRKNMSLI